MTAPPISLCWVHYRAEMIPHDVFIICYECGHVWTRQALEDAFVAILVEIRASPIEAPVWFDEPEPEYGPGGSVPDWLPAEKIAACPVCVHDF